MIRSRPPIASATPETIVLARPSLNCGIWARRRARSRRTAQAGIHFGETHARLTCETEDQVHAQHPLCVATPASRGDASFMDTSEVSRQAVTAAPPRSHRARRVRLPSVSDTAAIA